MRESQFDTTKEVYVPGSLLEELSLREEQVKV